jgi:hypothetical protein
MLPNTSFVSSSLLFMLILSLLVIGILPFHAFGISPSFSLQEIRTNPLRWIDVNNSKITTSGDSSTDIRGVSYFSNGRTLNATIWLAASPLQGSQDKSYGMLIDTYSNKKAGGQGIDYQIELEIKNKTWIRSLKEWSSFGYSIISNSTGIVSQRPYVLLSASLDSIGSPAKYTLVFYSMEKKGDSELVSFSDRIFVPSDKLATFSILPAKIYLATAWLGSQSQNVQVLVNSTSDTNATLNLFSANQAHIHWKFNPAQLFLPAHGMNISTMTAYIPNDDKQVSQGSYKLPLYVNFSNAPATTKSAAIASDKMFQVLPRYVKNDYTMDVPNLVVNVYTPYHSPQDWFYSLRAFGDFLQNQPLIVFAYLIGTVFSTLLVSRGFTKQIKDATEAPEGKDPKLKSSDIIQSDATIIVGALILLTLSTQRFTFLPSLLNLSITQTSLTALVVIPFAISAIMVVFKNTLVLGVKFMVAGFVFTIISISLVAFGVK